jgi:hypothetical protein
MRRIGVVVGGRGQEKRVRERKSLIGLLYGKTWTWPQYEERVVLWHGVSILHEKAILFKAVGSRGPSVHLHHPDLCEFDSSQLLRSFTASEVKGTMGIVILYGDAAEGLC